MYRDPAVTCCLRVLSADAASPDNDHAPGATITGLCENDILRFTLVGWQRPYVYIDDIAVPPDPAGCFSWQPGFVAGQVDIVVVDGALEHVFFVHIAASKAKLRAEVFDTMADEVHAFRAALLLGDTSATRQFGEEVCEGGLPLLVRLMRLLEHAPVFLQQVRAICGAPHRKLQAVHDAVPLCRIRRLPASALRMPTIVALATGQRLDGQHAEHTRIPAWLPSPTFDTPSNRMLKALLCRVVAHATEILVETRALRLGGDKVGQQQRLPRREAQVQMILDEARLLLRREPLASVTRLETSAAGYTQVAAQPAYSRACRTATKALWTGFGGATDHEQLPIRPTWGVYEAWCFVHLMRRLEKVFGAGPWRTLLSGCAGADEAYALTVAPGVAVEIYFQAIFHARDRAPGSGKAWSISRQRIPDIVVVVRTGEHCRFVVLDAKFRKHRHNVLEAMESAHLYRDSLRIGAQRPGWCVLLLPAPADVPHLEGNAFLDEHGVGTFSEFSPEGVGVDACIARIASWASA